MDRKQLEEIANTPGFGGAARKMQAAGAWDEFAGAGPVREFTVHLDGAAAVSAVIVTKTRCKAEAEQKGREQAAWEIGRVDVYHRTVIDSLEGRA